jgi:hypothetical protein
MFLRFKLLLVVVALCLSLVNGLTSTLNAAWVQPPTQLTTTGVGNNSSLASDANGNAIGVAYTTDTQDIQAFYYTNGSWGSPQVLVSGTTQFLQTATAMDATGTGLVVWNDATSINSAYFNAQSFSSPIPTPIELITGVTEPAVAMDGNGNGVAVWIDNTSVRASFFSAGFWSLPTTIGTGTDFPSVDYSANGTAVACWSNSSVVTVSNYVGGTWQPPVILGSVAGKSLEVGIDAAGKAVATFIDLAENVNASIYDSGVWSLPQIIQSGPSNYNLSFDLAPNGRGVLVWSDAAQTGRSSTFNGSSFEPILQFSDGPIRVPFSTFRNRSIAVSVDPMGNALVAFGTDTPQYLSAKLPTGGIWGSVEIINGIPTHPVSFISSALSANGIGFALWEDDDIEAFTVFASVTFIDPARGIGGRVCKNKFASQTDHIHIITWAPSLETGIITYNLRRNGVLIAVIPAAGPFIYYDHNRCRKNADTYTLTTVAFGGAESAPLTIVLR